MKINFLLRSFTYPVSWTWVCVTYLFRHANVLWMKWCEYSCCDIVVIVQYCDGGCSKTQRLVRLYLCFQIKNEHLIILKLVSLIHALIFISSTVAFPPKISFASFTSLKKIERQLTNPTTPPGYCYWLDDWKTSFFIRLTYIFYESCLKTKFSKTKKKNSIFSSSRRFFVSSLQIPWLSDSNFIGRVWYLLQTTSVRGLLEWFIRRLSSRALLWR